MFYAFSETGTWSGANRRCVDLGKDFCRTEEFIEESCPLGYKHVGFKGVNLEEADRDHDGRFHLNLKN